MGWDGSALTEIDGVALALDPFDAVIADDRGTTFTRDPGGALIGLSRDTETASITRDPQGWPIRGDETAGTRLTTWGFAQDVPLGSPPPIADQNQESVSSKLLILGELWR